MKSETDSFDDDDYEETDSFKIQELRDAEFKQQRVDRSYTYLRDLIEEKLSRETMNQSLSYECP